MQKPRYQRSAQGQVLHCKLRHQGCNSAQRLVFHCKLRNQVAVLLGMNLDMKNITCQFFSYLLKNVKMYTNEGQWEYVC